jgi:hypothetical protein
MRKSTDPRPVTRGRLIFAVGVLAWLLLSTNTLAQPASDPRSSDWQVSLVGGAVKQFETSIDSGGDFEIDNFFVRASASRNFANAWNAGITVDYGEDRYKFSGNSGFGGLDPWSTVRNIRVSLPIRYRTDSNWTFIGVPSLRYSGERGASFSDSQLWGLFAGAAYRFSDSLTIGPGFGVFTDIEDSNSVFPILLIDWKISDTLSLRTGAGLEASRGPGVSLSWAPAEKWSFGLGTRYEKSRFRLDDSGPAPDGVGEDRSVPVAISAKYMPSRDLELTLLAGVEFAGRLRLEDRRGNRLSDSDYDKAPFAGAFARVRF